MRKELIERLRGIEAEIRALPDANHEEIKSAQSAAQAAASLEEGQLKRDKQESLQPSLPLEAQAAEQPAAN